MFEIRTLHSDGAHTSALVSRKAFPAAYRTALARAARMGEAIQVRHA